MRTGRYIGITMAASITAGMLALLPAPSFADTISVPSGQSGAAAGANGTTRQTYGDSNWQQPRRSHHRGPAAPWREQR